MVNLFQTFADLESVKDRLTEVREVREVRELLDGPNDSGEHGL